MADITSKDTNDYQTVSGTKENDNIKLAGGHGRLDVFRGGADNVVVGNGAFYSMKSVLDDSIDKKTRDI